MLVSVKPGAHSGATAFSYLLGIKKKDLGGWHTIPRIAEVRVTGLAEQVRSADEDTEDCLSRVSAELIDEAHSEAKMEAYIMTPDYYIYSFILHPSDLRFIRSVPFFLFDEESLPQPHVESAYLASACPPHRQGFMRQV